MPIAAADANRIVRKLHYSGKIVQNSQVHLGVFLDGTCGGALSFGPSIDKHRMRGLVRDTAWRGFIELNRMALAEWLPRNSESRALAFSMRWLRANYPHIEWCVSFADATACGDGTIYRAAGFMLVDVKRNTSQLRMPDGRVVARKTLDDDPVRNSQWARRIGAKPLPGYQIKYVYFLNPAARQRLTVPELPYTEIERVGAGMYRGRRARGDTSDTPVVHTGEGGAAPTLALSQECDE
jgi:hypothetical protein